jgi:hypothetical protein
MSVPNFIPLSLIVDGISPPKITGSETRAKLDECLWNKASTAVRTPPGTGQCGTAERSKFELPAARRATPKLERTQSEARRV